MNISAAGEKKHESVKPLLMEIISTSRARLGEAVSISLVTNILAMAVPIFTMQIYDRVVVHKGITTLQGMVIIIGLVILFDTALRYGRARLFQRVGLRVDIEIGRHLYNKISRLPLSTIETRDVSSWQTAFRDVETLRSTFAGPTMITALDLPFAILFLIVIYVISPNLLAVFAVLLPLYIILAFWSGRVISRLSERERESGINRDMLLHEMLAGRSTVKALALERAFKPKFETSQADAIGSSIAKGASSDFYQVISQSIQLSSTIIITCVGALLILQQELSMGTLIAVNMLSSRMVSPIAGLVGQWRAFQSFRQALQRLADIHALPSEREDANLPLDRPNGTMQLEKISYGYSKEDGSVPILAIKDVASILGKGGIHCLMGNNGSGKSTLLKLMAGLYRPLKGRIMVDGADIAQFSRRDLAGWVGYLPQDCVLFADTIRGNIQMGGLPYGHEGSALDQRALDTRMVEAAKLVGSHNAILDLPDGYDTKLGEGGFGLSSGQRRRIALARAMMPDPPILLLDEPTSDLDAEAEGILIHRLQVLSKDHTIIVATHSPTILNQANSILLLKRGHADFIGTPSALAHKSKRILEERKAEQKENAMQAPPVIHEAHPAANQEQKTPPSSRQAALAALKPRNQPRPDF